jgi:hypothetical protein
MAEELRFSLSRHARRRMRQRHISLEMIERALRAADQRHPDRDDAELMHALKRFQFGRGSAVLRVVYNVTVTPWLVVTIFFDRKLSRKR